MIVGSNPELLVVGEGPGQQEDWQAEPFVGPSGDLLRRELNARGIHNYALTNATRCYPGDTKAGLADGVRACNPYLLQDIEFIKPKVILALGLYALHALGIPAPNLKTYVCHVLDGPGGVPVVASLHPAAILREPGDLHLFERAVLKARLLLDGYRYGTRWDPEEVDYRFKGTSRVTIDCETDNQNPLLARPVTIQVTCSEGTWVVECDQIDDSMDDPSFAALVRLWTDPNIEKGFQNGEYDIKVIERYLGARIQGYAWDTMLAENLLHEEQTSYAIEVMRGYYTDQPVYERELKEWLNAPVEVEDGIKVRKVKWRMLVPGTVVKSGKRKGLPRQKVFEFRFPTKKYKKVARKNLLTDGYASVPRDILIPYGIYDTQTTWLIWHEQEKVMSPAQRGLLRGTVLPMQLALIEMERDGIRVDLDRVEELREIYLAKKADLEAQLHEFVPGLDFKVSNPDEVANVLYKHLGMPTPPRQLISKKTGKAGSGKKVLEWLKSHANHPILEVLEEWRAVDQLIKTFLGGKEGKGLMSHVSPQGRLHTTFNMCLETGRQSSSPNLQNLPTKDKGPIRELLIADEGNVLVQADYSQIELRVAAYESNDENLIAKLESGADIHTYFARKLAEKIWPDAVCDLPDDEWAGKFKKYRTFAKRFTFGRLFGQTDAGMAFTFNIEEAVAAEFGNVYAELFPGMQAWWDWIIDTIRNGKPLITRFERRRRFPFVTKLMGTSWRGYKALVSHMEREGLNFLPQSTAADILSTATGRILAEIQRQHLPIKLRLVVHDSLTVECAESYKDEAARFLKEHMERVPRQLFGWKIPVEVEYGRTWAAEGGKIHV